MTKESSLDSSPKLSLLLGDTHVDHQRSAAQFMGDITAASTQIKKNPLEIALSYAPLAAGPGRLSPDDFIRLRLFDDALYSGVDRREFVGARRYRELCFTANYRHDWLGMLYNKIASATYLREHGLPVIPSKAIYAPYTTVDNPNPLILHDTDSLERFLLTPEHYPLFGKPAESQNSLGSIALAECSLSDGTLLQTNGVSVSARALATEIDARYSDGYLFQDLIAPHPAIAPISGGHLATVRLMTIVGARGPQLFRACWKIPGATNAADNYWRPGNLLAQLDRATGCVMRVTSGAGLDMQEYTVHPDTHIPLVGFVHPQWEAMKALALEGAQVMRVMPLIGWDIACTDKGPVIVEMNEHPDSFIMQFADRRGLLDDTFKDFIEFQKREHAAFTARMKVGSRL